MTLFSLTQFTKLSQFHISSGFFQKHNFLKRQETKMSSRDVHVTSFVHTKLFALDQPSLIIG